MVHVTDPPDVNEILTEEHGQVMLAIAKITKMFIEGLNDAVTLPEVHSEAEEATHYLLGCSMYMTMFLLMSFKHDVDNDDTPEASKVYIGDLVIDNLTRLATCVVSNRGPIGEHACDRHKTQE